MAVPRSRLVFIRQAPGRYVADGVDSRYVIEASVSTGGWVLTVSGDAARAFAKERKGELVVLARQLEADRAATWNG